MLNNTT